MDREAANAAFHEGNVAYEAGDYRAAAEAYERAASAGAADARLHFNHGNALIRLDRLGPAVLQYERALRLAPSDPDIAFNLEIARARVTGRVPGPEGHPLERTFRRLHDGYSLRAGIWTAYSLFAAAFAGLAISLFTRPSLRLAWRGFSAACLCLLLALAPSLALRIRAQERSDKAVVLAPEAEVYGGPGTTHQLLFRVHEGTVFTIRERKGEWLSVRLPDGRAGFVLAQQTEEV